MFVGHIEFPKFSGLRCLMMPYIQGDSNSIPDVYALYKEIVDSLWIKKGEVGFLTIDESFAFAGKPHRGARAKYGRALHTEAGRREDGLGWGDGGLSWGDSNAVRIDPDVEVLIANNIDDTCAIWDSKHYDTSFNGDIGYCSEMYPYENAIMMKAGDVYKIGVLTPHESLPVPSSVNRQFLRIVSSGVRGREPYFTENPLVK